MIPSSVIGAITYSLTSEIPDIVFGEKVRFYNGYSHKITLFIWNVQHLYFERCYDHKLTPDIFCNVRCLTVDYFPFDSSCFPTEGILKLVLCNISQVTGNNQLPKSISSLSLIKVKLDPKFKYPESLCHMTK
ncbi:hypothetical protein ACTFIW_001949 [Dictyostelium discoideum]